MVKKQISILKGNYAAKGGIIGLLILLIVSLLVRANVINSDAIINIFYFPLNFGFDLFTGLTDIFSYLGTTANEPFAIFVMFSCLVLSYHLLGALVGWMVERSKGVRK